MSKPTFASGSVAGTGAAINIPLGFKPDYVRVVNVTDADQIDEWFASMTFGTSIQTNTAVATRATNGISPYDGSGTVAPGFTIGSGISENGKTLAWFAMRSGD